MSRLLFTGGTVVTAEGSFQADVLVEDEKIVAVGTDVPRTAPRPSTPRASWLCPAL
jgi:dihydropyrimidinase